MRFDLDDKKKIELICELLKALSSGRQTVLLVWHRTEGWAILQNPEYLDNLDSSNMVNLCQIRSHFFNQVVGEGKEHMCFELDISSLSRVLKSVKYAIKKMIWSAAIIQGNNNNNLGESQNNNIQQGSTQTQQQQQQPQSARLQLFLCVEEGQLEVSSEIGTVLQVNPQIYFRIFREFTEDKTQYLEIRQSYLQQLQDLKRNQCVFFRFYDGFVSAYNEEQENNISIKNTALNHYDFNQINKNLRGKNLLTIPPNFLVPQVMIGLKLKDPIQLLIGDDIVDDHVCVSLRTKSDSFTFISQFKSIIELDIENRRYDPFELQQRLLSEYPRKDIGESQFNTAKQDLQENNNNQELNSNIKNHQDQEYQQQQQQMSDSQFFVKDTQPKKESKLQQQLPSANTKEKEIIKTSSNKQYEVHKPKEYILDQGLNNQNDQEISSKKENTSQKKQQQQLSSKSQQHKNNKESQLSRDNTTSQLPKDYEFYGKIPSQANNNTSTRLNSQAMKELDYQAGLMDGPGIGVSQIQSVESHIQGLTNNMQLADRYRQDPLMSLPLESQSNLFNNNNTQNKMNNSINESNKTPQGGVFETPQQKSQKSQRKLFKNSSISDKKQQQNSTSQQISQNGGKDDSVVFGVSQNTPQGNNSNFGVTSSHIAPVINQVPTSQQTSQKGTELGKNNPKGVGQGSNNTNNNKKPSETTTKKRKNGKQQLTLDESTRKIVHKDNGDQDKLLHRTDLLSNPTLSQNNNNNNAHSFSSFLNNKKEKDFSIFKLDTNLTAAALQYQ